ncbi:MAG: molybdopterin-dependent oxidoreductase [Planctomycetaceae bacterium]
MSSTEVKLIVRGEVENPCQLSMADLQGLPATCQIEDVSSLTAGRAGSAIRLSGLLAFVKPKATAKYLTLHAARDDFHASIPLEAIADKGILIYRVGSEPLSVKAGGPYRFFIPDHAACRVAEVDECANVKFVDEIEFSATRGHDNRPHDDAEHAALHAKEGTH